MQPEEISDHYLIGIAHNGCLKCNAQRLTKGWISFSPFQRSRTDDKCAACVTPPVLGFLFRFECRELRLKRLLLESEGFELVGSVFARRGHGTLESY